jgi:RsmE family RNA methyltransferase
VNLVLISKEESTQGISNDDPRVEHLIQTVGLQINKTFFVGIKNGPRGIATITSLGKKFTFTVAWEKEPQKSLPLVLLVGLPRPQTAKKILYEAACLGIKKICFFVSEKGDPGYLNSSLWKNNEWEDFLLRGAEQACCCIIPEVVHNSSIEDCLGLIDPTGWKVALDPYTADKALKSNPSQFTSGTLAIGPERGWSENERALLKSHGFNFHHLGDRILRVETAVVAGSSLMLSELNAWHPHKNLVI